MIKVISAIAVAVICAGSALGQTLDPDVANILNAPDQLLTGAPPPADEVIESTKKYYEDSIGIEAKTWPPQDFHVYTIKAIGDSIPDSSLYVSDVLSLIKLGANGWRIPQKSKLEPIIIAVLPRGSADTSPHNSCPGICPSTWAIALGEDGKKDDKWLNYEEANPAERAAMRLVDLAVYNTRLPSEVPKNFGLLLVLQLMPATTAESSNDPLAITGTQHDKRMLLRGKVVYAVPRQTN